MFIGKKGLLEVSSFSFNIFGNCAYFSANILIYPVSYESMGWNRIINPLSFIVIIIKIEQNCENKIKITGRWNYSAL